MTDGLPSPSTIQLPPLALTLATSAARFVLTAGAAWLVKAGWVQSDQQTQVIQIGVGIVLGAAALAWSWYEKQANHKTAVAAVAQAKAS